MKEDIKKELEAEDFNKIKYVDGLEVRNTIDVNFGVIGSNEVYPAIPKGEIWFDEHYSDEKELFFEIYLYQIKLMKTMIYEEARKIIEKEFTQKIDKIPDFVVKSKKFRGFTVMYVDGRIIRKYIDPKFILGMHGVGVRDYSDSVIKDNEIWVDIRQKKPDQKYSLIHEYEEAKLMRKWDKYDTTSYNNAHDFALAYEKMARRKDGARYVQD